MRALGATAAPFLTDPFRRAWALAQIALDEAEAREQETERRAFQIAVARDGEQARRWLRRQGAAGQRALPPDQALRAWLGMDHFWHGARPDEGES